MRRFTPIAALLTAGLLVADAGAQSPVRNIAGQMKVVVGDLAETKTDTPVQTKQRKIVSDLDALIAALEKECQACMQGVKMNNPTRGMQDSQIRPGTGGVGDLVDPEESHKDWSKLSDRERDRILQSMSEGFPPEYRIILERYYRRLAEEKSIPAANAKGKSEPPRPTSPDEAFDE